MARGDGQVRREEILDAARLLFARVGADKTTMRGVAESVGISAAAVYGYFPDKTALYDAVAEAAFKQLGARFSAASNAADPVDRLNAMMLAYVWFGHQHPDAYAIAFTPTIDLQSGPAKEPSSSLAKQAGEQVFQAFHRAISDIPGLVKPGDKTDRLSRVIWATGHGLVVLSRSKADALPEPIENYVAALLELLLRDN